MQKLHKLPTIFKDHRVAQLWGIEEFEALTDQKVLLEKLDMVAKDLNVTVVNTFAHQFNPHGLSVVYIIAESHMAVHTWPEHSYMHIDLFTCSPKTNSFAFKRILRRYFTAKKISVGKISYEG